MLKKIESGSSVDRLERRTRAAVNRSLALTSSSNSIPNLLPRVREPGHGLSYSTSRLPSRSRVSFAGEDKEIVNGECTARPRCGGMQYISMVSLTNKDLQSAGNMTCKAGDLNTQLTVAQFGDNPCVKITAPIE